MNPLQEAIQLMTKEEARAFKLFVQKVQTQDGRKDVELFDHIRKSREAYDEDAVFARLYPHASKNTFHRLKSRLLHDINRSLVDLNLENNDTLRLWHLQSVVEFYLMRRHFELAHWFLRKAESLALKLHHHEALDIIYNNYIRLSFEVVYINPETYILRRRENQQELQKIRALDDVLAAVVFRTKVSQTWGERGTAIMQMLEDTVKDFGDTKVQGLNLSLRIKLFQSVSNILIDKRDYETLVTYVRECMAQFEAEGLFNRNTHETKLLMLTYLANAYYKVGDFAASLKQAELLGRAMKDYESVLQDKYIFFFYNILFVNYFKSNLDKAIALLEEMRSSDKIMGTPFYMLFIEMNLGLTWREKGNLRKAIKHIVAAVNHAAYKSAATGLKLRIAMAELMIRLNLKEWDVLMQRTRQVKGDFQTELGQPGFRRESALFEIIAAITDTGDPKVRAVQDRIKAFLKMQSTDAERDAELIDYDAYLKELLA